MSEAASELRMTVAEFLRWDGDPGVRYELIDGRPRAMAPARSNHATIVGNATHEIALRLEDRPPCRANPEAGIWYSDEDFYEADVAVICSPPDDHVATRDPILIVEVVSPSTRTHDRGRKLDDYKTIASVAEVWLIDSEKRRVEVWRRDDEGWAGRDHVGRSSFESTALHDAVTLDRLYRNTTL